MNIIQKARLAWRMRGDAKKIEAAFEEADKMGKKWWESTQVIGAILKSVFGLLAAFGVLKLSSDEVDRYTQGISENVGAVALLVGPLGAVFGQVMELWGKRKHAEKVATVTAPASSPVGQAAATK